MRFDERYKVYLDITAQPSWVWNDDTNATWVEVTPDISEFQRPLVDGEYFHRYKWGKVTFRNKPYQSKSFLPLFLGFSLSPSQSFVHKKERSQWGEP